MEFVYKGVGKALQYAFEKDGEILTLVAEDLAVKHSFPWVTPAHLLDPLKLMSTFPHLFFFKNILEPFSIPFQCEEICNLLSQRCFIFQKCDFNGYGTAKM